MFHGVSMQDVLQNESSLKSPIAIGLMALSLFSFSGCTTAYEQQQERLNAPVTSFDRGHGVYYIPTSHGEDVSRILNEILKNNPEKEIGRFERTGGYSNVASGGAGFIVILEDR